VTRARKLPPDEEVAQLYASGLSQTEIGRRFGVSSNSVSRAVARGNGLGDNAPNPYFFTAGKQSVDHIETHGDQTRAHIEFDDVYRARRLQIHECADLLREWGVSE